MKATQSKLSSDREHLIEAKSRLEGDVEKITEQKLALQKQLSAVKQELTQIQTKVLPEAESVRNALSIELAMQKKATEVVEMQVEDFKTKIDQMKQELNDLEKGRGRRENQLPETQRRFCQGLR
jgi:prefoldin subunit 5